MMSVKEDVKSSPASLSSSYAVIGAPPFEPKHLGRVSVNVLGFEALSYDLKIGF